MIRFACPGCAMVYTVEPGKGGKTGKCPKCQSQFIIPQAEGGAPSSVPAESVPPPAPPPLPPVPGVVPMAEPQQLNQNEPIEVSPCPGCQSRLTVLVADLGKDVECPSCRMIFAARLPGAVSTTPAPPPPPPRLSRFEDTGRRRYDDDDDEDDDRKSSKRRRVSDDDDDEDRPRKRSRYNDDEDDRPRKKKRKRSKVESQRMVAGILALLLGGWGVHKFYLGYTGAGIIQIVLSLFLCGIGSVIGLVEAIIYLTKTDEEFIDIYQRGTKEWF
jgi:TM2 domain-containing membrane protein YozV